MSVNTFAMAPGPFASMTGAEIHRDPGRGWTTDDLARAVGVSRATLARRFRSELGQSPAGYLTTWRMDLAARQLRNESRPVAAVARSVGYTSEFAFSRAFARVYGLAPGRYRREHQHNNRRAASIGPG